MQGAILMQRVALLGMVAASVLAGAALIGASRAQEGPGGLINPQRDCQTIRTCNFRRGGSYRGCLSSYSCRVCRFVRVACKGAGTCQMLRCGWGGIS